MNVVILRPDQRELEFFVFSCKNIVPKSSYEQFEAIYIYLHTKADKPVVLDFYLTSVSEDTAFSQ